jgi:hypothetical protein
MNIHVFISIKLDKLKPSMKKEANTTFTKFPTPEIEPSSCKSAPLPLNHTY